MVRKRVSEGFTTRGERRKQEGRAISLVLFGNVFLFCYSCRCAAVDVAIVVVVCFAGLFDLIVGGLQRCKGCFKEMRSFVCCVSVTR